ncbi:MAG: lysine--tRNA ligase [Clostridia bacterium]|nr:lysine--tRNA ligase [Clostridia bacterium]
MDEIRQTPEQEQDIAEVVKVRKEKLAELISRGKNPFEIVRFDRSASTKDIVSNYADYDGKEVTIAGRMMSKRIMGKASFANFMDGEGTIQGYFKRDDIGLEEYADFKKFDIGDIVGICGTVFTTHTGEVSINAKSVKLLSKSLLPLPEKFHGLTNLDLRYRQRYVDLIANPEVKATFIKRSKIVSAIREFLDGEGFLEVETPVLNTLPGGANARPFITHHNTLDIDMYMRIATELYLKMLVVGGFEKVYEMGRIFRNEGMDTKHNPEFTTVELYQAYVDYNEMMDITEKLFCYCAEKVLGTSEISYQGEPISLGTPWKRITMVDVVKENTGIDFESGEPLEELIKKGRKAGADLKMDLSWGKALYEVFDQLVESTLVAPTFVIDYPVEVSPLAKKKPSDNRLTERFELFITAREMANAFSELNDPIDQKERFMAQMAERAAGDDEAQVMNDDFINALEYGLPPTGGLGIGIDRMVMLLTDSASIRDVLLFPTMKPLAK